MATTDGQTTKKPTSLSSHPHQNQLQPPAEPDSTQQPLEATADAATAQAPADGRNPKAIYVSYRELKGGPTTSRNKKSVHVKRFYLVDSHGNETLAATGEDQGDAHYIYRNAEDFTEFGLLDCHNRKELVAWLDRIKQESQDAADFHLIEDPPDQVLAASPVGSPVRAPNYPPFVAYRQEKFAFEDGHRGQKWYLVDESGHEQLAVTAEERETRDGHYTYRAEGPLAQVRPLLASNMGMVQEWLEQMLQHPLDPHLETQTFSGARLGKAHGTASGFYQRRSKSSLTDHNQQLKRMSSKRTIGDAMQSDEAKRQKLMAMEGTEAGDKELVAFDLRKLAAEESVRRKAVGAAAMEWVQEPVGDEQAKQMRSWLVSLQTAIASLERQPSEEGGAEPVDIEPNGNTETGAKAPSRIGALLDALEALREIGAHHFSLRMLAETDVVNVIKSLKNHKEASIAGLASRIFEQLRQLTAAQVRVLTDPEYLTDPSAAAEAALRAAAAKFASRAVSHQPSSLVRGIAAQLHQLQPLAGPANPLGSPGPNAPSSNAQPGSFPAIGRALQTPALMPGPPQLPGGLPAFSLTPAQTPALATQLHQTPLIPSTEAQLLQQGGVK